jgi:hypothetical protein
LWKLREQRLTWMGPREESVVYSDPPKGDNGGDDASFVLL